MCHLPYSQFPHTNIFEEKPLENIRVGCTSSNVTFEWYMVNETDISMMKWKGEKVFESKAVIILTVQ